MKKWMGIGFALALPALAHDGAKHPAPADAGDVPPAALVEAYKRDIAPIFRAKCYDCHGTVEKLPWYYKVPGAKQLIDYDRAEAKKHLDMSEGYPFKSHADWREDLREIGEAVAEGEMPPWQYLLLHRDAVLNADDVAKIEAWIGSAEKK